MLAGEQFCPYCKQPVIFISNYHRWFCPTCQRYLGILPGKSRNALIAGLVVLLALGAILPSAVLYVWVSGFMPVTPTQEIEVAPTASIYLSSVKKDTINYYNITIVTVSTPIEEEYVRVYLNNSNILLSATRENYMYISANVYMKWSDNDFNYKLTARDIISVKAVNVDLSGTVFKLLHIPTGTVIAQCTLTEQLLCQSASGTDTATTPGGPGPVIVYYPREIFTVGNETPRNATIRIKWVSGFGDLDLYVVDGEDNEIGNSTGAGFQNYEEVVELNAADIMSGAKGVWEMRVYYYSGIGPVTYEWSWCYYYAAT